MRETQQYTVCHCSFTVVKAIMSFHPDSRLLKGIKQSLYIELVCYFGTNNNQSRNYEQGEYRYL